MKSKKRFVGASQVLSGRICIKILYSAPLLIHRIKGRGRGPGARPMEGSERRIFSASSVRNAMNRMQSGVESFGNMIGKMRNTYDEH